MLETIVTITLTGLQGAVIHLTKVGTPMMRMSCMESKCQRMTVWMMLLCLANHIMKKFEGSIRQISILEVQKLHL
jgi:hypothetical protein